MLSPEEENNIFEVRKSRNLIGSSCQHGHRIKNNYLQYKYVNWIISRYYTNWKDLCRSRCLFSYRTGFFPTF